MGLVTRNTKTGGTTSFASEVALGDDTILDSEVDADFDTLYAEINGNLDDANIKVGANVATAKLAQDAGIVNAHISASAAIAGTKLAVGAVAIAQRPTPVTPANTSFTSGEVTLADLAITTTGGKVDLRFLAAVIFQLSTGSRPVFKVKRDATVLYTMDYGGTFDTPAAGILATLSLILSDTPVAGTYTYAVTGIHSVQGGLDSTLVRSPYLELLEWR